MKDLIVWVAKRGCGCVVDSHTYDPKFPQGLADSLREWQRQGLSVEKVNDDRHEIDCCTHAPGQLKVA